MSQATTFLQSRRRLLSWLGGLLLGYALLGFLLLPWFVESQLKNILQSRLSLALDVESVYFNPFSFYFEIEQLHIADPELGELLELESLQLNFQASRLALMKLQFDTLRIDGLDIYYARTTTEDDTLSRLAERWSSNAAAEPNSTVTDAPGELVPLEIISLSLSRINTHISDAVPATPFSTTLSLAQAQIDNFSTLPDQSGNNTLAINFEQDARLLWNGGFTVNPLDFSGDIALENFSLLPLYRYLQDSLPLRLDRGHIDLRFNYDIDLSLAEPRIQIDEIDFALNELNATQRGAASPFIEAVSLALSGGRVSLPENRAEFTTLTFQGIEVDVTRDASGQTNIQEMLDILLAGRPTAATQPASNEAEPAAPWLISLTNLSIENNRVSYLDSSLETPFAIATSLDASAADIDNQTSTQFPFTSTLTLDSGGNIELVGTVQALPSLELESTLSLADISIAVAQPYISEFAYLELESGLLDLEANIVLDPSEPFSFRGGVELSDVEILDRQLNETLLSMSGLGIDALNLSLAENSLDISEIALQHLFARVLINEDGSSNIGRSIKSTTETPAAENNAAASTTANDPIAITVGRVQLDGASANFTDRNLPLPFNADIQNLAGSVQGFASNSSQATDINLEGQVDEFGLVQIVSSLNLFDFAAQSQIDVDFSNIDMPSMTPYIIKFAGREVAEGKVDVGLSYELNGGELNANNQLVLSALQLGERVEQAGAMDLPLDLAIALLKDGNGIIDLEVPITGNVRDPEFDFGPAIRRAITNILSNIIAAPFRLLGNLVGGGEDGSLEQIRFLPGRYDIAAPEQEILLSLGEALKQRPQLLLEIPAMSAEADELALRTAGADAAIETQLELQTSSDDSLTQRRMAAVEILYTDAGLDETLDAIRALHTQFPESETPVSDTEQPTQGQLDTLAYVADLRERLIAAYPIADSDLALLAMARHDSIVEFLTSRAEIPAARLLETESLAGKADEDGWLILPFGLTAQ